MCCAPSCLLAGTHRNAFDHVDPTLASKSFVAPQLNSGQIVRFEPPSPPNKDD